MKVKRIGILTGGGDVPGLNSVIKGVAYRGSEMGLEVLGIRRGWEGLTHVDLRDAQSRGHYLVPLTRDNTRSIDRTGGTYLHTSRTNPSQIELLPPHLSPTSFPRVEKVRNGQTVATYDLSKQVLKNLEDLRIDYLVAVGGDDTLGYAAKLERLGVRVVAIPKTRLTREETVVSDLTYDLRGGKPDFVDKMVANTFGNMAMDCIVQGKSGLMMGIVDGCYAMVPIPDPGLGPRKVDVATMYNTERYRPIYTNKVGLSIFLTRA